MHKFIIHVAVHRGCSRQTQTNPASWSKPHRLNPAATLGGRYEIRRLLCVNSLCKLKSSHLGSWMGSFFRSDKRLAGRHVSGGCVVGVKLSEEQLLNVKCQSVESDQRLHQHPFYSLLNCVQVQEVVEALSTWGHCDAQRQETSTDWCLQSRHCVPHHHILHWPSNLLRVQKNPIIYSKKKKLQLCTKWMIHQVISVGSRKYHQYYYYCCCC